MPVLEKSCSRCGQISWSSVAGNHGRVCKDGRPCDTNGSTYVDGDVNVGRLDY